METLTFSAKTIYADKNKEEKYYMIGLADDPINYQNYIIAQRAFKYDETDVEQGVGSYYVEVNGQQNSAYKCCTQITVSTSRIVFDIVDRKIKGLNKVIINIAGINRTEEFDKILSIVFDGVPVVWE